MIDEATRAMRARRPEWDALRERRVLARIESELDAKRGRSSRRLIPIVGAAVAAAAIAIGVIALPSSDGAGHVEPSLAALAQDEPAATTTLPGIPPVAAPAIALADGSVATLYDGASLELRAQTDDEIRIDQIGGRVHYEVVPDLPRTFVVEAAGVQVQVVGTAFWVAHEPAHVRISVEHGRVRVNRFGDPTQAELGPGDELRLEQADDEPVIDTGDDEPTRPRTRTKRPTKSDPRATVDELLRRADAAAAARDTAAAIAALREIVDDHPSDPNAYSSAFKLGKLERARGRHAAAAAAFTSAARRSPSGTLSADARAEAAIAWFDAGQHDKARAAGEDYLERHPSGEHVARIQRMLDRLP